MRYIVIPDFLARLEEASLEEARFEKGMKAKVKKVLRAERKEAANKLTKSINDRKGANSTRALYGPGLNNTQRQFLYNHRLREKLRAIKAAKKDRPKLP